MRSFYQETIREIAAQQGYIGIDTRHVEAWMRVEHSTLAAMGREQFDDEVRIAIHCIQNQPTTVSETLARSYGL